MLYCLFITYFTKRMIINNSRYSVLGALYTCHLWHRTVGWRLSVLYDRDKIIHLGLPRWLSGKESACQFRRYRFDFQVREIPWRRRWQSSPVCLPGKFHGQTNLGSYSLWDGKRVGYNLATKQQQTIHSICLGLFSTDGAHPWKAFSAEQTEMIGHLTVRLSNSPTFTPCRKSMLCLRILLHPQEKIFLSPSLAPTSRSTEFLFFALNLKILHSPPR